MNNTALRAEKEITNTIIFRNEKHKDFYQTYMKKCRRQDVYHKALIYCLGISEDTRVNIDRIYDLRTGYVKTECLQEGWQTSGSVRIVRIYSNDVKIIKSLIDLFDCRAPAKIAKLNKWRAKAGLEAINLITINQTLK